MSKIRISGILASAILTSAVLAGCGTQQHREEKPAVQPAGAPEDENEGAPTEPEVSEFLKVTGPGQVTMPLDAYMLSPTEHMIFAVAKDVSAAKCMRDLGFTSWKAGKIRTWYPEAFVVRDHLEYLDPAEAARSGYPRITAPIAPADLALPELFSGTPTKEEAKAFEGVETQTKAGKSIPSGGCIGQAGREVGQAVATEESVSANFLNSNASTWARGDSRVLKAVTEWRGCMKETGHDYHQPTMAENDTRWTDRTPGETAGDAEKSVASADAECRQKVNLIGIYLTIKKAHQDRLFQENKPSLEKTKAAQQQGLQGARSIIKQGG